MIRFYLDTDDDFDLASGLDFTEEVIAWDSRRRVDKVSRAEVDGLLSMTIRRGRALATWWRVGRMLEGRVGDFVFFRGFMLDAVGLANGKTRARFMTWLGFLRWRGQTPDVVGLSVIDAVRAVLSRASVGLPGARIPSGAVIEDIHDEVVGRRLYWRDTDAPLFWRGSDRPLYWRRGPTVGVYSFCYVGETDTVGDRLLVGPLQPQVVGESVAVVGRLTSIEYNLENYEYGEFIDEIAALASGERGWIFSGGGNDVDCIGRDGSAAPDMPVFEVMGADFGRFEYEWQVGEDAIGQVVGREPDVQESSGVLYRQERVSAQAGLSSWRVALRDRGRPAEAAGELQAAWAQTEDVSVAVSSSGGDIQLEVFNATGGVAVIDWIEVTGRSRVYQGGEYGEVSTGRYGGRSVELPGVFGGSAGLTDALDYWVAVGARGGLELRSVTLDGRRFAGAWGGQLGGLLRSDALTREGAADGPQSYWITGIVGEATPQETRVRYELMRYVEGSA